MSKITFAFDLGVGSFASCIKKGSKIVYTRSIVMPEDLGSTKLSAQKRRAVRTRNSHKARELWLIEELKKLGIKPLKTIEKRKNKYVVTWVDPRLQKEFPSKDENQIYTSCLLRVKILEEGISGLEDWQIFKALHSAIQKRGYDAQLPWANDAKKDKSNDEEKSTDNKKESSNTEKNNSDEKENLESINLFINKLNELGFKEEHKLPCFFEAYKMGVWDPKKGIISIRQSHQAQQGAVEDFKGYTAPRELVEKELRLLLQKIKRRYPTLDIDYILYGPTKKAYGTYKDSQYIPGKETDWKGVLSQKIPRFDNRLVGQCCLIPRFNTCRKKDSIYIIFNVLHQLHNLRVISSDHIISTIRSLNKDEINLIFNKFKEKNKITHKDITKILKTLNLEIANSNYKFEMPKADAEGRCAYSRPALKMLIFIYLNRLSADKAYELISQWPADSDKWPYLQTQDIENIKFDSKILKIKDNKNLMKGITIDDLEWLKILGKTSADKIYIPNMLYHKITKLTTKDKKDLIKTLISDVKHPIVRERLYLIIKELQKMQNFIKYNFNIDEPDYIVLEVVREHFMGEEKRKEYIKVQKENEKERKDIIEKLKGAQLPITNTNILKLKLLYSQDGQCIYTGDSLNISNLEYYHIDHIYPQSKGGPSALYNLVLTTHQANTNKGNRTPYEWLSSDIKAWAQFKARVNRLKDTLGKRKVKILLSNNEEIEDIIANVSALAATSWIEKLMGNIFNVYFGWNPQEIGAEQKIYYISGKLTSNIRERLDLNKLTQPTEKKSESSNSVEEDDDDKKNRDNPKHHILDAMCLAYIPDMVSHGAFSKYIRLYNNEFLNKYQNSMIEQISYWFKRHVVDYRTKKPVLEENFYGLYQNDKMFQKMLITDLAYKTEGFKKNFNINALAKNLSLIKPYYPEIYNKLYKIYESLKEIKDSKQAEAQWVRESKNIVLKNGTTVKKIKIIQDISKEMYIQSQIKDSNNNILTGIQLIKPKGSHKGYYVLEQNGKYFIQPVYAWQNRSDVIAQCKEKGLKIHFFIKSGDYVRLEKSDEKIPKGIYRITTIKADNQIYLIDPNTLEKYNRSLDKLIKENQLSKCVKEDIMALNCKFINKAEYKESA